MLNFWKSAAGMVKVRLTGADLPATFRALNQAGIHLRKVETVDLLTAILVVDRIQWKKLQAVAGKRGDRAQVLNTLGFYWTVRRLLRRPVLTLGLLVIVTFFLFLPTRVLFLQVEGCRTVPENQILEAAFQCGLSFGVSRRALRSEQIKNDLLSRIPELKWAGVNTRGCVAVIKVEERETVSEKPESIQIASIVAACDGVVSECTAERGNLLCRPGQAVLRDQVLISGYTDNGHRVRATCAKGEVYARTVRKMETITTDTQLSVRENQGTSRCYSLLLGKNRIKLWGTSGNSDAGCGRMYSEYYVTLPGGYVLPLALAVDSFEDRSFQLVKKDPDQLRQALQAWGEDCLQGQMIAGRILSGQQTFSSSNGICSLKGEYLCSEMIGRVRPEKIGE